MPFLALAPLRQTAHATRIPNARIDLLERARRGREGCAGKVPLCRRAGSLLGTGTVRVARAARRGTTKDILSRSEPGGDGQQNQRQGEWTRFLVVVPSFRAPGGRPETTWRGLTQKKTPHQRVCSGSTPSRSHPANRPPPLPRRLPLRSTRSDSPKPAPSPPP